jgi:hypothetical protein
MDFVVLFFLRAQSRFPCLLDWQGQPLGGGIFGVIVCMVEGDKEKDRILFHGIDLAIALELEVGQVWCIKIDAKNGAGIQPHVVPFVPLSPGIGDRHGKANQSACPFLFYQDGMLGQGDWRRHHNGRMINTPRERLCDVSCDGFFYCKNASCLQDYSNMKWTLHSHHCCDKLCSKVLLREL